MQRKVAWMLAKNMLCKAESKSKPCGYTCDSEPCKVPYQPARMYLNFVTMFACSSNKKGKAIVQLNIKQKNFELLNENLYKLQFESLRRWRVGGPTAVTAHKVQHHILGGSDCCHCKLQTSTAVTAPPAGSEAAIQLDAVIIPCAALVGPWCVQIPKHVLV